MTIVNNLRVKRLPNFLEIGNLIIKCRLTVNKPVVRLKIAKQTLIKAKETREGPMMALLGWRNTPTAGHGVSPAQTMFNRRTRTLIPTKASVLQT